MSHPSPSPPSVYFGGSRALVSAPLVAHVVRSVMRSGAAVHVGCAAGADTLAIYAALRSPLQLSVFAVGDKFGVGFPAGSGFQAVSRAAHSGASVSWLAGGSLRVPMRARLIRRSQAAFAGCSQAVFFLASPGSSGSLAVAAKAVAAGLPVFAFLPGFSVPPAPLAKQAGRWSPVHSFSYYAAFPTPCWVWQPAAVQAVLL